MEVEYKIGEKTIRLKIEGAVVYGQDETLLDKDENLLSDTPFNEAGYAIQPFIDTADFVKVKAGITEIVKDLLAQCGVETDDAFSLSNYHRYADDETHKEVSRLIQKGWDVSQFPIDFSVVENRITEIVGLPLSVLAQHVNASEFYAGTAFSHLNQVSIFNLRIARPGKLNDNNPPHRDVWLDRLRNAINIYAPLSGSTSKSSIALIPGSHFFNEARIGRTAEGAMLNGVKYTVPCVVEVDGKTPELLRVNPAENEVLVFSPYLIHGGGYNFENDVTRVSLEVRFWRKS